MWSLKDFTGVLKYQDRAIGSAFVVNGYKGYIATCRHLLDEVARIQITQSSRSAPDLKGFDDEMLTFHLGGASLGVPVHFISASLDEDVALLQYSPDALIIPLTPPLLERPPAGSEVLVGGYAVIPDNKYSVEWFSTIGKIAGDYDRRPLEGGNPQYLIHMQSESVIRGMSGAPVVIQGLGIVGIQSERYYPPREDAALREARWVVPIKALVELAPQDLPLTTFTAASPTETEVIEILKNNYVDLLLKRIQSELEKTVPLTGRASSSFLSVNPEFELLAVQDHPQSLSIQREPIDDIVEYILSKSLLRIAIVGPSGCGKTTSLNLMALRYCSMYKAGGSVIIPAFINLSGYQPGDATSIEDFIFQQLPIPLGTSPSKYLHQYILLIDAFDELSVTVQDELVDYLDLSVKCNFVIGCRSSYQDRVKKVAKLRLVEVMPLNELKIRSYIRWHLDPDEADRMFWELLGNDILPLYQQWQSTKAPLDTFWQVDAEVPTNFSWDADRKRRRLLLEPPPLLEMARNPYLLRMMITIYKNQQRLSMSKRFLMRDFVRVLIRRGQLRGEAKTSSIDEVEAGLGSLAYRMINDEVPAVSMLEALQAIAVNRSNQDASDLLTIAIRGGLIDQRGEALQFRHSMLRAYLACVELAKRIVSGDPLTTYISPHKWWEPNRWTEVFTFIPAIHGSADLVVGWLMDVQPELAAQCLRDGKENRSLDEVREQLRNSILRRLGMSQDLDAIERSALGRALGLVGDNRRGVGISSTRPLPEIEWIFIPEQRVKIAHGKLSHTVSIRPFYISRYPVTNDQYSQFLHSRDYKNPLYWTRRGRKLRDTFKWYYPKNYGYPFNLGNHPVVGISWHEGLAFCRWLSKQTGTSIKLPSIGQWMAAAQSPQGISGFPWGATFDQTKCNARESGVGSTTAVGLFPEGQSRYKIQDCGGNVWEYCLPDASYSLSQRLHQVFQELPALLSPNDVEMYLPIKGGSFTHFKRCLLIGHDIYVKDTDREWDIGFRPVKEL